MKSQVSEETAPEVSELGVSFLKLAKAENRDAGRGGAERMHQA